MYLIKRNFKIKLRIFDYKLFGLKKYNENNDFFST